MNSDDDLVAYLERWRRSLIRLQRAYPARWHVPGLSEEETRDALLLTLLEVARTDSTKEATASVGSSVGPRKAGRFLAPEEVLRILRRRRSELFRRFRLGATPVDFVSLGDACGVVRHELDHEACYVELENEALRAAAADAASAALSRPQRRWLSAFKLAAHAGNFFGTSEEPNLSAASRVLGRHRSSAQRAYRELQSSFQRERRRWDG